MASNLTWDLRLITRNDTGAAWDAANPILLKGEVGYDSTAKMFKVGDGVNNWQTLEYVGAKPSEEGTTPPDNTQPTDKELGSIYVDTTTHKAYVLLDKSDTTSTWKEIVTPEQLSELGAGDMLKADFATNDKAAQGYVDKAIAADKLVAARTISLTGDATGSVSFDGSANADIPVVLKASGVTAGEYTKVTVDAKGIVTAGATLTPADIPTSEEGVTLEDKIDALTEGKQDKIEGAASSITSTNLTAGKVVISDENGKIAASGVDATTLAELPTKLDTLAGQVDNIPKFKYLEGVNISVPDDSDQTAIDTAAAAGIAAAHADAAEWDAVVVNILFTPSDIEKDAIYYYNGTAWTFLYYVSTGIQRANGSTAGIVEDSADITFASGLGTVVQAGKVKNTLTIGDKTFDGSAPVVIESTDLADTLPIGGADTAGAVKSSEDINKVKIESDATMTVNKIDIAKIDLNGNTLILNGGNA